jgi:Zn-dependent protease/CBS domain-containing protein
MKMNMFTKCWRLFRLLGIPISVDASWLVILALVTWTLTNYFQHELPGREMIDYWVMGLVTALAFFGCIVLHELGHASVGRALGMQIRGITLFMFGGVAELGGEPPSARSEFLMAIAGPLVSAILGAVFWLVAWFGREAGWPEPLLLMSRYLFRINLIVLVFNLIPAFPLDGGRALRSILWGVSGKLRSATRWASSLGQGFAWLLILSGVFSFIRGFQTGDEGLLFSGLWSGLIGMFLNGAARSSYQQVLIRQALEGEPVRRFMNDQPIVVSPTLDLRHWVEDFVYRFHRKIFPVASDGHLEGFITTRALAQFPRSEWDQHTVGEAMVSDVGAISIPPDADALQALAKMQSTGASRLLVTEGGRLLGIISLKDLLRFLHLKMELEDQDDNGRRPFGSAGPSNQRFQQQQSVSVGD